MTALKQMGEHDLKELGIPMVFSVVSLILLYLSLSLSLSLCSLSFPPLSFALPIYFEETSIDNYFFTRFLHFLACLLKCSDMSLLPYNRTIIFFISLTIEQSSLVWGLL